LNPAVSSKPGGGPRRGIIVRQTRRFGSAPLARGRAGRFAGSIGLSVAVHLAVLAVLGILTWAVQSSPAVAEREFTAELITDAPPSRTAGGGFQFPGQAMIDRPDSSVAGGRRVKVDSAAERLSSSLSEAMAPVPAIGLGDPAPAATELGRLDVTGIGEGSAGSGFVTGSGSGQAGSGLGDRDLAGGGPVGSLWGVGEGQRARSIVYVMDRSESMSDTFQALQRELMKAIGSLEPEQSFNVLWFNDGEPERLFRKPLAADLSRKRRAFAAIRDVIPTGSTNPIESIRQALKYRADVVFLLTDGDFRGHNRKILAMIGEMNKDRRTVVNTILFVYDTVGEGERVLRSIAEENGGVFKHVTAEDIRAQP
jgi:hypothetical protein